MQTYKEHYLKCKKNYTSHNEVFFQKNEKLYNDLYDLRLDSQLITQTDSYKKNLDLASNEIKSRIDSKSGTIEKQMAIYLDKWKDIPSVCSLVDIIMPQLEAKVFKSYVNLEFLYIYRNKPAQKEESSWLWHYDDCPDEFLKLVIYLNDVTETNGCFQYLSTEDEFYPKAKTNRVCPNHTGYPQVFPKSRIPEREIQKQISKGCHLKSLTGPKGTYALMTPNIYHRATVPKNNDNPRDCMFFFIRPSLSKRPSYTKDTYLPSLNKNVKSYALN
tara:strand:+ start:5200 stop:6018 length:819 start_codon:yes stop_codon:yes gene_type:complete